MNTLDLSTSNVVHVKGVSPREVDDLVSQLHQTYLMLPFRHESCKTVDIPSYGEVRVEAWPDMATLTIASEQAEWVLFHSSRCSSMGGTITMSGESRDAFGRLDLLKNAIKELSQVGAKTPRP